jgi:urocanate hydratase
MGSQGLAAGIGVGGPVTITAAFGAVSGSTYLTVTAAELVSIDVAPSNPSIASGTTQQFTAIGTYADASQQNLTTSVTWSSSNTGVATISNAGGSEGLAAGSGVGGLVTIAATLGPVQGTASLTVTAATLVSIDVTPLTSSISKGSTQQFTATGTYSDASHQNLTTSVTWSSSNTGVATISNAVGSQGLARGAGVGGPVTITATLGSVQGTASLAVTAATLVSIAVTSLKSSIANGTTRQFTATGTYTDASHQNLTAAVTWSSSNTGVATISNAVFFQGLATAVGKGTTTIKAADTGTGIFGTTSLTVKP